MRVTSFVWTPEKITILVDEYEKGTPPFEIAKMVGNNTKRSVVIVDAALKYQHIRNLTRNTVKTARANEGRDPLCVNHPLAAILTDDEITERRMKRGEVV